jgi:hypothetical protein
MKQGCQPLDDDICMLRCEDYHIIVSLINVFGKGGGPNLFEGNKYYSTHPGTGHEKPMKSQSG